MAIKPGHSEHQAGPCGSWVSARSGRTRPSPARRLQPARRQLSARTSQAGTQTASACSTRCAPKTSSESPMQATARMSPRDLGRRRGRDSLPGVRARRRGPALHRLSWISPRIGTCDPTRWNSLRTPCMAPLCPAREGPLRTAREPSEGSLPRCLRCRASCLPVLS